MAIQRAEKGTEPSASAPVVQKGRSGCPNSRQIPVHSPVPSEPSPGRINSWWSFARPYGAVVTRSQDEAVIMATTSLVVEMVIIGCFSTLWLLLAAVRVHLLEVVPLCDPASVQSWVTPMLFVATAIMYQVGWVINAVADALTAKALGRRVRDRLFSAANLKYETARALVYHKASPALIGDIMP